MGRAALRPGALRAQLGARRRRPLPADRPGPAGRAAHRADAPRRAAPRPPRALPARRAAVPAARVRPGRTAGRPGDRHQRVGQASASIDRLGLDPGRVHAIHLGVDHDAVHARHPRSRGSRSCSIRHGPGRTRTTSACSRRSRWCATSRPGAAARAHRRGTRPGAAAATASRRVEESPRDELVSLYRRAAALVFPSLYEGFGLPPVEAMACGCPVAAPAPARFPRSCGDAAVLFDPLRRRGDRRRHRGGARPAGRAGAARRRPRGARSRGTRRPAPTTRSTSSPQPERAARRRPRPSCASELLEGHLRLPAEHAPRLRRVADEVVELGRAAAERRVGAHVVAPVEATRRRRRRSTSSSTECD